MNSIDANHYLTILQTCKQILSARRVDQFDFIITSLDNLVSYIHARQLDDDLSNQVVDAATESLEDLEAILFQITNTSKGRPKLKIPIANILELLELKFSSVEIAKVYGVSRMTIYRRLKEANMTVSDSYSTISNDELEDVILDVLLHHPYTGYKRMIGFLSHKNYKIQEHRVREAMRVVDPLGVAERTRQNRAIFRRVYFVKFAMDRWHLDTNLKLSRRYKMVIRGCVDGNSRMCIYLKIGADNKSISHLYDFMDGIREFGVPVGIRCDKGGENRLLSRLMLTLRGMDKGAVLTGRSVHNQRIERFWVDVKRDTRFFLEIFASMEEAGILNIDNHNHLYVLHKVFLPRIQRIFDEFKSGWNLHGLSTERNQSPMKLFIKNRPPDSRQCLHDKHTIEEVFQFCSTLPNPDDQVYHPVRNPSPVQHDLDVHQLLHLQNIDVLQPCDNYGIDIYKRCLEQIGLDLFAE